MSDADRGQDLTLEQLRQLSPPTLEVLRRQTTAFLYAIWRVCGQERRIIEEREYQQLRELANKYRLECEGE